MPDSSSNRDKRSFSTRVRLMFSSVRVVVDSFLETWVEVTSVIST